MVLTFLERLLQICTVCRDLVTVVDTVCHTKITYTQRIHHSPQTNLLIYKWGTAFCRLEWIMPVLRSS